jgi:hypothetical protein
MVRATGAREVFVPKGMPLLSWATLPAEYQEGTFRRPALFSNCASWAQVCQHEQRPAGKVCTNLCHFLNNTSFCVPAVVDSPQAGLVELNRSQHERSGHDLMLQG